MMLEWVEPRLIKLSEEKARGDTCYTGNSATDDCCTGSSYFGMGCEPGACP